MATLNKKKKGKRKYVIMKYELTKLKYKIE